MNSEVVVQAPFCKACVSDKIDENISCRLIGRFHLRDSSGEELVYSIIYAISTLVSVKKIEQVLVREVKFLRIQKIVPHASR